LEASYWGIPATSRSVAIALRAVYFTYNLLRVYLLKALKAMQWGVTTRSKASAETTGDREVSDVQTSGPQKQGTDSEGELVSSALKLTSVHCSYFSPLHYVWGY
jgi:hypothetical protein